MNGIARRVFSVLVATAILCALVPAASLAVNDPWTESVIADSEDKTEQFESITSSEEKPGGVRIAAENGHDANVTVSGAIQSEGTAASIEANGEDSDITFKSGNVTVQTEHENWSGYGVNIWTSNHATVNAETGSVSAPGEAVNVYAEEQSEAHVTVNGDAVSRDDNGVQIWAGENSTADVTVTGSYGDGLLVVAENGGEVAVTVNGDVTSADEGLALSVDDTSTADILVTGNLRAVFPDGHEEEGSFDLVDDVLVLVNAGATNMPVGEDGRVTFTSMDGPQQSIEATLDPMTIAVLRAALG